MIYSWAMRLSVLLFECIVLRERLLRTVHLKKEIPPSYCSHTVTIISVIISTLTELVIWLDSSCRLMHLIFQKYFQLAAGPFIEFQARKNEENVLTVSDLIQLVCVCMSLGCVCVSALLFALIINGTYCRHKQRHLHFRDEQERRRTCTLVGIHVSEDFSENKLFPDF